jgi:hypothetical protein
MTEINENYALNLCEFPSLTRCSEPVCETHTDAGRVFAIGASHMKRIVGGLVSKNLEVINLSRSGWKADKDTISETARKLKEYNLKSSDTIVIDPVSNSVFCGTDESGNPVNPVKDEAGTWHIVGELAFRPKTVIKKILADLTGMFEPGMNPRIIVLVAVPRYVLGKCCDTAGHISNIAEPEFVQDLDSNLELIEDLLTGWAQNITDRADILNFRTVTDDPEAGLPDLQIEGDSIWSLADPVHGSDAMYKAMATALASMLRNPDPVTEPEVAQPRRARLESVVVQREQHGAFKVPARSTASWSTGSLPPTRGTGGRARGDPMRGRFFRGRGGGWARPYGRGRGRN